jgi:hypothetical protein
MTNYNDLLKKVKEENPGMPYKEQQKKASELHRNLVKGQEGIMLQQDSPAEPAAKVGNIPESVLADAERRIREIGVNINTVIRVCKEIMPEGKIVKNGVSGVNSLITFEDGQGNRVPVEGNFIVWI